MNLQKGNNMSIRIITDSGSDIAGNKAARMGVTILPLKTLIDGIEYRDGIDLTAEDFYPRLKTSKSFPTTSQITPSEFESEFSKALEAGDEVLAVTISGKLSGTYQSACAAAAQFPDKIRVVDSASVSPGQHILISHACRLRDEGLSLAEIADKLEMVKGRICVIALFDTLEYLFRGGRLSRTAAIAGALLNIKPVLTIENGEISVLGKARGMKQSNNFLNEEIGKRGGVDFSMPYMLAYSGSDPTTLNGYINSSRHIWEEYADDLPVSTIGSTIGTHAGPGAVAVAFFSKN